ncbi:unnamed protein product [Symbiodinium sp. CCMP2592]|nr:unnamed protein product [Symbiodinium sp. CCMP2592]
MPGLFVVGIHPALLAAHAELGPRAELSAFLDDTYASCDPADACAAFVTLRTQLKRHANIDVHLGKTRVWYFTGEQPPGLAEVLPTVPGEAPIWVGDHSLPPEQQGFLVLGTPFGSEAFKKDEALNHSRICCTESQACQTFSRRGWFYLCDYAGPRKAAVQLTGHPGQIPCQSYDSVIRELWRRFFAVYNPSPLAGPTGQREAGPNWRPLGRSYRRQVSRCRRWQRAAAARLDASACANLFSNLDPASRTCSHRLAHGSGVQTFELLLSRAVARKVADTRAACLYRAPLRR